MKAVCVVAVALSVCVFYLVPTAGGALPLHYVVQESGSADAATIAQLRSDLGSMGLQQRRPLMGRLEGQGFLWETGVELSAEQLSTIASMPGVAGAQYAYPPGVESAPCLPLGICYYYAMSGRIDVTLDDSDLEGAAQNLAAAGFVFRSSVVHMIWFQQWIFPSLEHSVPEACALASSLQGVIAAWGSQIIPYDDCAEDVNSDYRINLLDLLTVRDKIGSDPSSGENWRADVNRDGRINLLDMLAVRNRLNTECVPFD